VFEFLFSPSLFGFTQQEIKSLCIAGRSSFFGATHTRESVLSMAHQLDARFRTGDKKLTHINAITIKTKSQKVVPVQLQTHFFTSKDGDQTSAVRTYFPIAI